MPGSLHNWQDLPTSPNWSTAPDWANYWAFDKSGGVYYYECKPQLSYNMWTNDTVIHRINFVGYVANGCNWQTSLQKRPTT